MFDSLLPTKLYLPPIRADWVQRPRLLGKLDRNSQTKLILVSAPAGYGKTTLVTAWLRQLEGAEICWLSLDENDSDPQHFFRYLAAAVRPLPDVQSQLPPLLQSNQPIPAKTLIKAFTHDVIPVAKPFVLVLDDYHVLDSAEIENALATLLDLMPPQMTLVLTSRSDPGFPISRLRARGELVELRADDLRFTEMEAAQFLQQTMGLTLQPAQVAALENRTEGWIAGLQMAALSLQNRSNSDLDSFVDTFTGSHRFVIDYLVEETLLHQPDAVRTFLLATAVLERLSGPLCAAVTQMPHAQEILEMLERNNLFVVPLDEQRHWYRYHHLFADVLRAYAHDRQPAQIALWHQRASDWFAAQDALSDALPHAFAAQNFAEAARLLELIRSQIGGSYQFRQWLRWADRLPADLLQNRPVLAAGYGWALLFFGEMAASQPYFAQAEQAVTEPAPDQIVYDLEQWRLMPALLANARAYRLMSEGDVVGASQYARQARDFFGPGQEHHYWRQAALSLLDLTHWFTGDIPAAADAFAQSTESRLQAGVVVDAISTAMVLAE